MKLEDVTEAEWTTQVFELLRMLGFSRIAHFRPAKNRRGQWSTPMSGDVGFPDITATGRGRLAFLELKTEKGKASPDQEAWLAELATVSGIVAGVFRPSDLDRLTELLRRR